VILPLKLTGYSMVTSITSSAKNLAKMNPVMTSMWITIPASPTEPDP
jgi:hypothetical protein